MAEKPLIVAHIDTGSEWRGGQQQVYYLYRALCRQQIPGILFCEQGSALEKRLQAENLPCIGMKIRSELDLRAAWQIACHIRRLGVTILHAHSAHALGIGLLVRRFFSPLKLIAARRVDFSVRKPVIGSRKYRTDRLHKIITVSSRIREVLIGDGVDPDKIAVIHSGIPLDKFETAGQKPELRTELGIPPDHFVVGTVAALAGHKDYPNLLRAARQVILQTDRITFCAVGDGPEADSVHRLAQSLQFGKRFVFTGFREDVGSLLKSFDLFVLASKKEGLGTSVLDALLVGLPVVATRAGGIPEMITDGQNGLLVPVRDPVSLAEAILRLCADAEMRNQMADQAVRSVRRFDIRETIRETLTLYRQMLAENDR